MVKTIEIKVIPNEENEENGLVKFELEGVTDFEFKYLTGSNLGDKSTNKSVEITISGDLQKDSSSSCKRLAEWAKATSAVSIYRQLEVVYKLKEEIIREYRFPNAFICDYIEGSKEKEKGYFRAIVMQKFEKIDDIKIKD